MGEPEIDMKEGVAVAEGEGVSALLCRGAMAPH